MNPLIFLYIGCAVVFAVAFARVYRKEVRRAAQRERMRNVVTRLERQETAAGSVMAEILSREEVEKRHTFLRAFHLAATFDEHKQTYVLIEALADALDKTISAWVELEDHVVWGNDDEPSAESEAADDAIGPLREKGWGVLMERCPWHILAIARAANYRKRADVRQGYENRDHSLTIQDIECVLEAAAHVDGMVIDEPLDPRR